MKIIIDIQVKPSNIGGNEIDTVTEIVRMLRSHPLINDAKEFVVKEIYVDDDGEKITVG